MKRKQMWKLGVAALIVGTAAYWSGRTQAIPAAEESGAKVFPGLDLSAVARLEIIDGTNAAVIARQGDSWQVLSLSGYPADMTRLRHAMLRVRELSIGHTAHGSSAPASGLPEVRLEAADGSVLAMFLLGEVHERELTPDQRVYYGRETHPDGRYVAEAPGKPWRLVADPLLDFSADPLMWVERFIPVTYAQQVTALRLSSPGVPDFELARTNETWSLQGLTPDQELDAQALEQTVAAVGRVFFENAVPKTALSDEEAGFVKPEILSLTTGSDLVYTLSFGARTPAAQTRYLRLGAESATGSAAAKQEAAAFNRRYGVWTYAVPNDLAEALTHGRTAFVKVKKPEPPKEENE